MDVSPDELRQQARDTRELMDKRLDVLEHRMRPAEAFRRIALKTAETAGTFAGRSEVMARRFMKDARRRWRGTPTAG
jgi:hypothetical protein